MSVQLVLAQLLDPIADRLVPVKPRVLIIDDDATATAVAEQVLTVAGIDVLATARSGEEALRLVQELEPTIVIVDVGIGGMGAATTVRRLRDVVSYRLDVIAQMSFSNVEAVADMIATGTAAFIVKGKAEEVVAAVRAVSSGSGLLSAEASRPLLAEMQRRYESELQRNQELESTVARLEAVSVTDWLTGLKNHGFFWDRLAEELERARRYDRPLAVVMIDIDDFKAVNDRFGHTKGDEVLRAVGKAIIDSVRESDVPCRVGGEEFAVIVPETDIEGAMAAAERVRLAVAGLELDTVGQITVSLGVALHPYHATNGTALVEVADRALYEAKRAGKNCSILASADMDEQDVIGALGPVVKALHVALGMKASHLVERSHDIAAIATELGSHLGLNAVETERLRIAALLHDVGMLGVPDTVLLKPSRLNDIELAAVRKHPEYGHKLIAGTTHVEIADAVRSHHEAFDGSGYPDGLVGDDIPLFGRIIHAADAFVAMQADRPDRPGLPMAAVVRRMQRQSGTEFDPAVLRVLDILVNADDAQVIEFPAS